MRENDGMNSFSGSKDKEMLINLREIGEGSIILLFKKESIFPIGRKELYTHIYNISSYNILTSH